VRSAASSASSCAAEIAPVDASCRVLPIVVVARSRRAIAVASWARSTFVSSSTRTAPCFTVCPDSNRIAVTTPDASAESETPFAVATLPTAARVPSHACSSATAELTASGGGPSAWAFLPKPMSMPI